MEKRFKLSATDIRIIMPGRCGCIASDRIPVDGFPVAYIYREKPDFPVDSSWRFLTGGDDQAYVDDPDNFAIYDINTIVNYDEAIVPYLESTAFVRNGPGVFVAESFVPDAE